MQDPLVPVEVNEQVTTFPELGVAATVTLAPEIRDERVNVGVSSEVLLSSFAPRSEAVSRSGVPGAAGLIVMEFVEQTERFPAASAV